MWSSLLQSVAFQLPGDESPSVLTERIGQSFTVARRFVSSYWDDVMGVIYTYEVGSRHPPKLSLAVTTDFPHVWGFYSIPLL